MKVLPIFPSLAAARCFTGILECSLLAPAARSQTRIIACVLQGRGLKRSVISVLLPLFFVSLSCKPQREMDKRNTLSRGGWPCTIPCAVSRPNIQKGVDQMPRSHNTDARLHLAALQQCPERAIFNQSMRA